MTCIAHYKLRQDFHGKDAEKVKKFKTGTILLVCRPFCPIKSIFDRVREREREEKKKKLRKHEFLQHPTRIRSMTVYF